MNMAYELDYTKTALDGIKKLEKNDLVMKDLKDVLSRIRGLGMKAGQDLEDMHGMDFRGYKKAYFGNTEYRVLFTQEDKTIRIIKVIAVGEREDFAVYKDGWEEIKPR